MSDGLSRMKIRGQDDGKGDVYHLGWSMLDQGAAVAVQTRVTSYMRLGHWP